MARALLERGWEDVRPLAGGFDAWRDAGFPVEPKAVAAGRPKEVARNLLDAEGDQGEPV